MECLTNACEDVGVIHSNLCSNENKPPRRIMASEEHVICPNCVPVFPLSPPDTQSTVSSSLCLWEHRVSEVPLGASVNYGPEFDYGGHAVFPQTDFIQQRIIASLELGFRATGIMTPTQTSDVCQWGRTAKTHAFTHATCGRSPTTQHVWPTPQQPRPQTMCCVSSHRPITNICGFLRYCAPTAHSDLRLLYYRRA